MKMVKNAAGRMVPDEINGREAVPFKGVGKHRPDGRKYAPPIPTCIDYPGDNNTVVSSLTEALNAVA
jgi:citrate lyase subunit alpha/citrate CoA-transferase